MNTKSLMLSTVSAKSSDLPVLTAPVVAPCLTNYQILHGPPITPLDRVKLYSEYEFEDLVNEWAYGYLKDQYTQVVPYAGPGDMGRDIVGYVDAPASGGAWDNYQCKHYDSPVQPSDIWVEFGKLVYFTYSNIFTVPRAYYIVAPKGCGPKLTAFLEKPDELRNELIIQWTRHCSTGITEKQNVLLTPALQSYIEQFDFSIIRQKPIMELLAEHRQTIYFAARFGGGLTKLRPLPDPVPEEIDNSESKYVTKLLEAYSDYRKRRFQSISEIRSEPDLLVHFNRSRETFFRAEALRQFGRDSCPGEGYFDQLKEEIYAGVVDTAESDHTHGYACVKETTRVAATLMIQDHVLAPFLNVMDKQGICHHLANEERLRWVRG